MNVQQSLRDLMEAAESLVYLEDLSGKNGLLQKINPLVKLIAMITMILASLFIFNLSYLLLLCIIPIILAFTSRIPIRTFFRRATFIPIFATFITIPILFLTPGQTITSANLSVSTITITSEGITRFLVFNVRVWFCVASLTLLVLSSGFDKMLALLSTIKTPAIIIQLFSLTYRYFFVSIHEAQSVLIAKEARTFIHKKTINMRALKDLGSVVATLFIRTYERSERVYLAMKARGFSIEKNTKIPMPSMHLIDALFASVLIIPVVLAALL
jgi:cobalt/nickel transport system permease protein